MGKREAKVWEKKKDVQKEDDEGDAKTFIPLSKLWKHGYNNMVKEGPDDETVCLLITLSLVHQKGTKIIPHCTALYAHTATANLKVSLPTVRLLHVISSSAATKKSTVAKTNQNQDLGPVCPRVHDEGKVESHTESY